MDTFVQAFWGTFEAVLKVFLIVLAAGLLVRRKIITQEHIRALTAVTVNVLLPCLIFSNIIGTFDPGRLRIWWVLPLSAVAMIFFGLLLGWLVYRRQLPAKKNMLALTSLQNAGYLILPIGSVLFAEQFDKFALYCFLYILAMSPLLWSMGKYLSTSGTHEKLRWKGLITPPFVVNVIALILVFTQTARFIPAVAAESVEMLGAAAVPLANFILGAVLGGIALRWRAHLADALRVIAIKLMVLPLATIIVLHIFSLIFPLRDNYSLLCSFLVLQAAAAPATGLILQVRNYGGDEEKIGSIMFLCYAACIVTLPFWMAVWEIIK